MIKPDTRCTGCMACLNICNVGAIEAKKDEYGFIYPHIEASKCVNCRMCEIVCPLNLMKTDGETKRAVGLYHKSNDILKESSSGGAMYAVAKLVLDKDGAVYGCAFDPKEKKFECRSTDEVELEHLMRSKYVESYVGDAYKKILTDLEKGRHIMFCGTPCQVAGLKNYLKKDYENLILVDFSCGGVPSQTILADYLSELEKKYKSIVRSINFRDKTYGWGQHCISVEFENGKIYRSIAERDPYFWSFLYTKSTKRASCANCGFQQTHNADLVLADFWKYKDFDGVDVNGRKGLSLVLAQTDKGAAILDCLGNDVCIQDVDIKKAEYNCKNRTASNELIVKMSKDRAYIKNRGITMFYKAQFGMFNVYKYRIKQLLLKVKDKNNG